jgi:PAS domain S-box-containing protein
MNLRSLLTLALVSPVSIAVFLRSGPLGPLTRPEYSPRRDFYLTHPVLLWTNLGNNLVVAASYALFIAGIYWLLGRLRHLPEIRHTLWILSALNIFFLARFAVTVLSIVNLWWPLYNFTLALNFVAAIASAPVAAAFVLSAPTLAANIARFFQLLETEQKYADALRKSEAFLDRTNRIAGVGGWEIDLLTERITWSEETYRIHGLPLDFTPTLAAGISFYAEEVRPAILAAVETAMQSGQGWDLELPLDRADGRRIWVRSTGQAEPTDGSPLRLIGTFQDVTTKVAERIALHLANVRFALAADSGGIGIFEWDLQTNICTCDSWMYRLHDFEKTSEPTLVAFWTQHMHQDDAPFVLDALNAAVEGPEHYNTEYRVVWRDGSVHHLRATGRLARDQNGRAISMMGANWDVTESRRLTSELAAQHELLSVTLQAIGDGVITTDADRKVTWLNPAAERMTGWAAAEAVGQPINLVFQTLNAETREPAENPVANYIAQGQAVGIARHTLLISRNGTEFGIENSVAPIRNSFGDLQGNVLVFRDVTEQRRLAAETERNAQLNSQLKLKDEFLSHVSHELRSPLSSIYSFTSIIADGLAGDISPEQNDYLHIIMKNVSQLQSMIEDLLTVTQSKEGKLTIDPQSVSVPDAIIDAIHTVQGAAAVKNIALSFDEPGPLPPALADPIRLQQILIILLDNAIKFTPPDGQITVSTSLRDPDLLSFHVSDTGCGIPPDKRTLVFENLYQVRGPGQADTSQLGRTGLGLGLHIARNLVTRQGGNIWVTEAPGGGSTFNFTLPIYTEAAYAQAIAKDTTPRRRKDDFPPMVKKIDRAA